MEAHENSVYGVQRKIFKQGANGNISSVSKYIVELIKGIKKPYESITVLCIGTDKVTGDCMGPLIGTLLIAEGANLNIIGTLDNPIHAKNLQEVYDTLDKENTFIIAIDASLGAIENIGNITVTKGTLKPGSGVGKQHLPSVGDISITAIVNLSGFMDLMMLQNTRLALVYRLAKSITKSILEATEVLTRENNQDINNRIQMVR